MADTLMLRFLRFMPRNLLSRGFGFIATRRRPQFLVRPFMRWFAGRFGIDLNEAELPFEEYPTLQAMFTRRLKPGARPIASEADALVSPVDAAVGAFGRIEAGRLIQAKGLDYSAEAFLGCAEQATRFGDGWFATLYLSPKDYHRIHSPVAGTIARTLYEPGTLWPVNGPAVANIPGLFAVNERVTAVVETPRGPVAVVLVGATNVGSMKMAYVDLVTNCGGARSHTEHAPAPPVERGGDIGVFQMGSTVILLVADPDFAWEGLVTGQPVRMGQVIGRYS